MQIRDLREKYEKLGDMTKEEISDLHRFYCNISDLADELGNEFGLMKKELHARRERFAHYVRANKITTN